MSKWPASWLLEGDFASLLFMVVDIVHSQTEILFVGMEHQVADAFGQDLDLPIR